MKRAAPAGSGSCGPKQKASTDYAVKSVLRAFDLLRAPRFNGEVLRLREFAARSGLHKTTAFRLLNTLQLASVVERVEVDRYRPLVTIQRRSPFRVGFAGKSAESGFSREIGASLVHAAVELGVDVVQLDNRNSAARALRNASRLIREQVDVAIEFQVHARVAAQISSKFLEAKIPLIALEIPHPGATYFGGDNFETGRLMGKVLAERAFEMWGGHFEEVLLLELPKGGPLPHSSLTGALRGIAEVLPRLEAQVVTHLNGNGEFGPSLDAVRKHLRRSRSKRFLVGAINDESALGALRALEEAGRALDCLVAGQNGDLEARAELRRPGTRFIGTVALFPERYGAGLLALAMELVHEKKVVPATFTKHVLLTPNNVDLYYPNDVLLHPSTPDDMIMRSL